MWWRQAEEWTHIHPHLLLTQISTVIPFLSKKVRLSEKVHNLSTVLLINISWFHSIYSILFFLLYNRSHTSWRRVIICIEHHMQILGQPHSVYYISTSYHTCEVDIVIPFPQKLLRLWGRVHNLPRANMVKVCLIPEAWLLPLRAQSHLTITLILTPLSLPLSPLTLVRFC